MNLSNTAIILILVTATSCRSEKITHSIVKSGGLMKPETTDIKVYQYSNNPRVVFFGKNLQTALVGPNEMKQLLKILECKGGQLLLQDVDHPSYLVTSYTKQDTTSCSIPFQNEKYSRLQSLLDLILMKQ